MGITKAKSSKNRRKSKSHAKIAKKRSATRAYRQPVVATIPLGPDASSVLRFGLFWTSVWALDYHVLGLLCSFA